MPHELPNDLTLRILGNSKKFKEFPETLGIDEKVLSRPPKNQIWTVVLQNCKKWAVKHSVEKPTYTIYWICVHYFVQGCRHNKVIPTLSYHTIAIKLMKDIRDQPCSICAKFSEKLTFLTLWHSRVGTCIKG